MAHALEKRNLIIDHDAGVDDLASIAIAMLSDRFNVDLITICPADSYKEPAIQITTALIRFLGRRHLQIAASDNEGKNLFPDKWRRDSHKLAEIKELQMAKSEYEHFGFSTTPAAQKLVEVLSQKTKYEILATGPLSNIADALKLRPEIKKNITKIYFMGGALRVHGNVERADLDLSAEWNVFNNPAAVDEVLRAHVPLVLVPLDATNKVPVTREFMRALAAQKNSQVSQLFHKIWSVIAPQIESDHYQKTYFFWDTLTSAIAANPEIGSTYKDQIRIVLDGKSEGRTLPDPLGLPIDVLGTPDSELLRKFILKVYREASTSPTSNAKTQK